MREKHDFNIRIIKEGNYYRLYVSHKNFKKKGRVRKRLDIDPDEHNRLIYDLHANLLKYFSGNNIIYDEVQAFVQDFINTHYKKKISIFLYYNEFIEDKRNTENSLTKNLLSPNTILTIERGITYFKEYLLRNKISPFPENINKKILNNFFTSMKSYSYNYRVKLFEKTKEYLKYLYIEKGMKLNPSFMEAKYAENYKQRKPDDIALSKEDIQKLLDFREQLKNGEFKIDKYKNTTKKMKGLKKYYMSRKMKNLAKSLDCFLFMIATGQYHADITNSPLAMNTTNKGRTHISYYRKKNNVQAKGIPVEEREIFIGKKIIEEYKIKDGNNFPYDLTLNTLNRHLKEIAEYAKLSVTPKSKMARKTFASWLYYNDKVRIETVQVLLGHETKEQTKKYLRIENDDLADSIYDEIHRKKI